jgi:phosphoribosylglycinamide formyltransferase
MARDGEFTSRLLVLISGNGSNLQALIDASGTPKLPSASIIRVISNRKDAYGLVRAQQASIPTTYHNLVKYKKQQLPTEEGVLRARETYDQDLAKLILEDKPDLVVCAGWMHILSSSFVDALAQADIAIINLHPALPGQFNGAGAIHRAYSAFQKGEIDHTGVMIHHVISEVDMGEPIVTREVPIMKGEPEEELEKRIHEIEWGLIVEGTAKALQEIKSHRTS